MSSGRADSHNGRIACAFLRALAGRIPTHVGNLSKLVLVTLNQNALTGACRCHSLVCSFGERAGNRLTVGE